MTLASFADIQNDVQALTMDGTRDVQKSLTVVIQGKEGCCGKGT